MAVEFYHFVSLNNFRIRIKVGAVNKVSFPVVNCPLYPTHPPHNSRPESKEINYPFVGHKGLWGLFLSKPLRGVISGPFTRLKRVK